MVRRIKNIISIDSRALVLPQVYEGPIDKIDMLEDRLRGLIDFLPVVQREVAHIFNRSQPNHPDMEIIGIKRNDVGYCHVAVENIQFERNRVKNWSYRLVYMTIRPGGSQGMAFGDTTYTREEARKL